MALQNAKPLSIQNMNRSPGFILRQDGTNELDIRQSTLFNVLCVTALGLLPTLFYTAYVCSPIYSSLRQLGICRPILEVGGSPGDLQYPGYSQRVNRDTIHFTYPSLSKGLLMVGSMVRLPIRKRLLRRASASQRCINP